MEKKLIVLTVRVDEETNKALETIMKEQRRSKSNILQIMIEDKIKEYSNQEGRAYLSAPFGRVSIYFCHESKREYFFMNI